MIAWSGRKCACNLLLNSELWKWVVVADIGWGVKWAVTGRKIASGPSQKNSCELGPDLEISRGGEASDIRAA